ncbi:MULTISPECIES: cytochrome P450 [Nocardia]|uniref:cytochrome P450 n=1 Tax=Nocardia TaxID=1817 RepID=UPI001E2DE0DC|nr:MULTISPECIES: cytochrome P450 [Nocardia]
MPLHTSEFATDPDRVCRAMRDRYGALAPVELAPDVPATLVIGYREALRILDDAAHYASDPRIWQQQAPADCPVLPLLRWRPVAPRSDDAEHTRFRGACTAGLDRVDLHSLRSVVERTAIPMINAFCESGSADLLGQYAFPLTFRVLNELLGLPPEKGQQALVGMIAVLNAADSESARRGNEIFESILLEFVEQKRCDPGDDLTSWLMADVADLDDLEMVNQTALLYAAGTEPTCGLILNTLLLMLTDNRFGDNVIGGSISTRDAIDEVLFTDPPWANFSVRYPRQPQLFDDMWLPAHQPVVISSAACNNDPAIAGDRTGNRAHLAWGAGPHTCPAQPLAMIIAHEAIDQLLDALPEITLAQPVDTLTWRSGPLHRMLNALPVTFPASAPLHPA